MNTDNIPSFLLRPEDRNPPVERGAPAETRNPSYAAIRRGLECIDIAYVILPEALDTTRSTDFFKGAMRPKENREHIDVGTVLVRRPVHPDLLPPELAWKAGRMHLDGVRWEKKIWPAADVIAFRDHVASLLEFMVPGDERPESRNLPVVSDTTTPATGPEAPARRD